jgi:hypothetical protein
VSTPREGTDTTDRAPGLQVARRASRGEGRDPSGIVVCRPEVQQKRPTCTDYRYRIRMAMSTKNSSDDYSTSKQPHPRSTPAPALRVAPKTDIGAGQAGLASAYHLKKRRLAPDRGFVVLDQSPQSGGAWQFRWPSLKLSAVNRIHDLPRMRFSEAVDTDATEVEASVAVPRYFAAYEKAFGLPVTPTIEAMRARGVLNRLPMFSEILEDGVRWSDGTVLRADVILWCTGFRSSLDHLAPLMLREPGGGITMIGRLATQAAKDPRVHLVGYGPSASTIGANRASAAAAKELMAFLGEEKR